MTFLFTTPSLDKTAIGDYLGENFDINKQVLSQHIDSFDFRNVMYVDAMRRVLLTFRLPGEG
jgi:brefeldin A-inhibited guanine nucleotide-exchange protein